MEIEATSHRSTEARHGGTVRWFVGQLGAAVVSTRPGGALDCRRSADRVQGARKRTPVQFQQAELWPAESAQPSGSVAPEPKEETVAFVNLKQLSRPIQRPERPAIRPAAPPAPLRSSGGAVSGLHTVRNMALYLTATGALEGLKRDGRADLKLPPRGLMSTLRAFSHGTETHHPSRFPG